jgi:hypothetical protein
MSSPDSSSSDPMKSRKVPTRLTQTLRMLGWARLVDLLGSDERQVVVAAAALLGVERPLGLAAQAVVGHAAVPLVAQVGLDRHVAAVAVPHAVGVRLDVFEQGLAVDRVGLELVDDLLPGVLAAQPDEDVGGGVWLEVVPAVLGEMVASGP